MAVLKSYAELVDSGKKVAFLKNNRNLNKSNLKKICESYLKLKTNISPIIYCDADKVGDIELIDALSEEVVTDKANYVVVVDGQHRFIASQKTIKEDSNRLSMGKSIEDSKLMFLECSVNESTLSELVAIANYAAKAWTSKDYLVGASMDSDDEALQFAAGLTKCGYSPSTISLILYNAEKKLDSHSLKRAFEDKALNHNGLDLERAKRFIEESRKKFEDTTIKKGFFVQYFLNNIDKISKLSEDDIKKVKKAKKSNFDKILKEIK